MHGLAIIVIVILITRGMGLLLWPAGPRQSLMRHQPRHQPGQGHPERYRLPDRHLLPPFLNSVGGPCGAKFK
jgi:hypothetical protein